MFIWRLGYFRPHSLYVFLAICSTRYSTRPYVIMPLVVFHVLRQTLFSLRNVNLFLLLLLRHFFAAQHLKIPIQPRGQIFHPRERVENIQSTLFFIESLRDIAATDASYFWRVLNWDKLRRRIVTSFLQRRFHWRQWFLKVRATQSFQPRSHVSKGVA